MKRHYSLSVGLVLAGTAGTLSLPGRSDPPHPALLTSAASLASQQKKILESQDFGHLPLSFEANRGQTDTKVRFLTHTQDSALFLTPSEAVFAMPASAQPKAHRTFAGDREQQTDTKDSRMIALRMQVVGANVGAKPLAQQPLPGKVNYFIGKNPKRWHTDVPTFGRVGFQGVYKGVDLVYYGNQSHLEYDFVVAPHADPRQITLHFAGAQGVHLDAAGDLVVQMQEREMRWKKPTVYQQSPKGRQAVPARFQLTRMPNGQAGVRFALGRYDRNRPLIIDPVLLYSTYFGGGNQSSALMTAKGIAVDSDGNTYVTGFVGDGDYPTTAGAYQTTPFNSNHAFVAKINATGTALIYSTYIGAQGIPEGPGGGIAIDSAGNAYVTGTTLTASFPTTPGAFQSAKPSPAGSGAGFVAKLNATGSALLYATYLGGTHYDVAYSIALDNSGNAYVTGYTSSTDFPTTPGAFQRSKNATAQFGTNAFVTKLNPTGTAAVYSTCLGGSTAEIGYGIAVDPSGNAYVTGVASSTDFPTTPGALQTVKPTISYSSFVTRLNATGTALVYSTYLSGNDYTRGYAIAVDSLGYAYVTGVTFAADFPTTPGAFQETNGGDCGYVSKLNPTGTALAYSTFLSGCTPAAIAIDSLGNAYITGDTSSSRFVTTPGAFQRIQTAPGAPTAISFVTKLNAAGSAQIYSTYLGGSGDNSPITAGIALDDHKNVYVVGRTHTIDFPVTPGVLQPTNHADTGANLFLTKLSSVPVFPDVNNDGHTDLLIQNTDTNAIASWFMQGATWVGGAYFSQTPPSDYALVGIGDFGSNGGQTLVLQHRTTNQVIFWYTGGTDHSTIPGGIVVRADPEPGWKVVGVGDFNKDGKSDLVFQNQTTNQIAVWYMNGQYYLGGLILPATPAAGWTVVGVGDLNADGFPDLVLQQQTTGRIALWYMHGPTYAGGIVMPNIPGTGWKVASVGDYNVDGFADLLFQNQTTNQAMIWYLSNGLFQSASNLSLTPPTGWKIVGPR